MFPILSIDFGKKHIGLAISDSKGIIASPIDVIHVTKKKTKENIIEDIRKVVDEYRVKEILIGNPLNLEGDGVEVNKKITRYIDSFVLPLGLPYKLWDESFSTKTAQNVLLSQGLHLKKNKKRIDSIAASVFLQEYLNSLKKA